MIAGMENSEGERFALLRSFFILSLIVPDADVVARLGEGSPGDVEPAVAGEQLVGALVRLQELHESLELR